MEYARTIALISWVILLWDKKGWKRWNGRIMETKLELRRCERRWTRRCLSLCMKGIWFDFWASGSSLEEHRNSHQIPPRTMRTRHAQQPLAPTVHFLFCFFGNLFSYNGFLFFIENKSCPSCLLPEELKWFYVDCKSCVSFVLGLRRIDFMWTVNPALRAQTSDWFDVDYGFLFLSQTRRWARRFRYLYRIVELEPRYLDLRRI